MSSKRGRKSKKEPQLSGEQLKQIESAFALFDSENKGSIEVKEVPFAMGALGWKPDPEKVKEVLTTIKQKEGQVTYDTFVKQMTPILKSQTDLDRLRVAFDLMDSDKHGYLTFKDLLKAAQEVGEEELDERDFEEMIKIADSAGKGMVSFDDFVAIMNYKPVKK